jgi:thymidylate synthase
MASHVFVEERTLPEAWERSVIECWERGTSFRTEYDKEGDPPSKDCTAMIVALEPLEEPRIHRAFPGGLDDLEIYRQEVVDGVRDHWIDPDAGKWSYTYHERLTAYPSAQGPVNQLDWIIDRLAETSHTRRAQAITYEPVRDSKTDDPPCLQRVWCRVEDDRLLIQVTMRSNDAFKAAYMNMFAFTELQRDLAQRLSDRLDRPIVPGCYTHFANSYHIYGSYFAEFKGFLDTVSKRQWEERVWDSTSELVQEFFTMGRERLVEEQQSERPAGL